MRKIRTLLVVAAAGALAVTVTAGSAAANRLDDAPTGGAPLSADMDGFQEIDPVTGEPGAGDLGATGFAIATINVGQGVACYELSHENLSAEPHMFHIHIGEAGTNGPIVVDFFTDPGGVVPSSGCVEEDRDILRAILANPEGYYFNVHTPDFPPGAIRGQLSAASR
jgi:hypothetical protein